MEIQAVCARISGLQSAWYVPKDGLDYCGLINIWLNPDAF